MWIHFASVLDTSPRAASATNLKTQLSAKGHPARAGPEQPQKPSFSKLERALTMRLAYSSGNRRKLSNSGLKWGRTPPNGCRCVRSSGVA